MKYTIGKTYTNKNFGLNNTRPTGLNKDDVIVYPISYGLEKFLVRDVEWKEIETFTVVQYAEDYIAEQKKINQDSEIYDFKETYYQDVIKLLGEYAPYSSVFFESRSILVDVIHGRPTHYFLPTDITDISYEGMLSLKDTMHSMKIDIECEQIRLAEESELLTKQRAAKEKLLQMMTKEELEVLGIK
jgi:hypothetical protein